MDISKHSLCVIAFLLYSNLVSATEFTVDSVLDENDQNLGDAICYSVSGACTLRAAIQEANATAGADIIHLPSGTYVLTNGVANEDMAVEGDLDVTEDLTIIGNGVTRPIVDANATTGVFEVLGSSHLDMQYMVVQNGYIAGTYGADGAGIRVNSDSSLAASDVEILNNDAFSGGGIYCYSGRIELSNTRVAGNSARSTDGSGGAGGGAGLRAQYLCDVSITNSVFENNSAMGYGGAIQMESGELLITGSTFNNNMGGVAGPYNGGALSLYSGSTTVITGSTFTNNNASTGSAIYTIPGSVTFIYASNFNNNSVNVNYGDTLSVTDAYLDGVISENNAGGGGDVSNSIVANSIFRNNTASYMGAGLSATFSTIRNSAILNNTAVGNGGGGLMLSSAATVENTTIGGNIANYGGGIYLWDNYSAAGYTFTNTTISGNKSNTAAAEANVAVMSNTVAVAWNNTIVANPVNGINCGTTQAVVSNGGNIDSDGTCGLIDASDQVTNPLLDVLNVTNNLYPLQVSSPAIGAAKVVLCPVDDQTGALRPANTCDSGAYDSGATAVTTQSVIAINESYREIPEYGSVVFTLTRSGSTQGEVSAVVTTVAGTAKSGLDYTRLAQVISWADGDAADKQVTITLTEDQLREDDEDFSLYIASVSANGSIDLAKQAGRVLILDNDISYGTISIAPNHTKWENKGILTINVSRLYGSEKDQSVEYRTVAGTALAGVDYVDAVGTLTWANGDTADKTITIEILDDAILEGSEQFTVELFNHKRRNAAPYTSTVTVTIEDDESFAAFDLSSASYSVAENAGNLDISILRSGVQDATSVWIVASAGLSDTAKAGNQVSCVDCDFYLFMGQLTFAAGETTKTISIPIISDNLVEGDETFTVELMSPQSNALLGEVSTAVATIIDVAPTSGGNSGGNSNSNSSGGSSGGSGGLSLPALFAMLLLLFRQNLSSLCGERKSRKVREIR